MICFLLSFQTRADGREFSAALMPMAEVTNTGFAFSWFIPLQNKVSVGIVLKEESSKAKKAELTGTDDERRSQHYHNQLKLVPGVTKLLEGATFLGEVQTAGDYSYSSPQHAGPNYRIAGDAGGEYLDFYQGSMLICSSSFR
jgi:flavin-dependent dehydrogenase